MRFKWLFVFVLPLVGCDMLLDDNNNNNNYVTPTNNNNNNWGTDDPVKPTTNTKLAEFLPTQNRGDKLVHHTYYSVSYSSKYKCPEWTAYELTASKVKAPDVDRRSHSFHADPANGGEASTNDYTGTGYDRGHLVPANDMSFNETAMGESFFMSNIAPQDPELNRGKWKSLEDKVRDWAVANSRIYVITGAAIPGRTTATTEFIGADEDVLVPKEFYKIVLDYEGKDKKGIAFLMKNEATDEPLSAFAVPISKIEEKTGINFFPKLTAAEQRALEQTFDINLWEGLE